ncbi:MAG TPA: STAS domain-containing protein [Armatimonadaceae bacterium]|nr:STAS domain-containing protein [Armatimonadaceae bacterium]
MNDTLGLHTTTSHVQEIPVVTADGDVDLSTKDILQSALESACGGPAAPPHVIVDLRKVPFIDSAGLSLLVEVRKAYQSVCRLAVVIERGTQPERVFRLGRFETFFTVRYSLEELLEEIASRGTGLAVKD